MGANISKPQPNKNSQKHDHSRILTCELRKRLKKGVRRPTLNIAKAISRLTLQHFQFHQIFLNIVSKKVNFQVLKLLTIDDYAKIFLNRSKGTLFTRSLSIWDYFIQAYQILKPQGVEAQREYMRTNILKYAGDLQDGKTPGNKKRKKAFKKGQLEILRDKYKEMIMEIDRNKINSHSKSYQRIKNMSEQEYMAIVIRRKRNGLNYVQFQVKDDNRQGQLAFDDSMLGQDQISDNSVEKSSEKNEVFDLPFSEGQGSRQNQQINSINSQAIQTYKRQQASSLRDSNQKMDIEDFLQSDEEIKKRRQQKELFSVVNWGDQGYIQEEQEKDQRQLIENSNILFN